MPKYRYTAVNLSGALQTGVIEGSKQSNAEEILVEKGYYPQEISLLIEKEKKGDIELSRKISVKDLAIFCNQFGVVLKAGVSILQSLEIMSAQTENKKLKMVLEDVAEKIQKGMSVSASFREHADRFPELFLSMLEAGEVSGNMDSSLIRMGQSLTKEYKLNQKVKNAMIYPAVLSVVATAVVIFLLTVIVPTFAGLYSSSGTQLPFLTRMMLGLGDFMSHNILIVILVILTVALGSRMLLKVESIRYSFDRFKLKVPVIGKLLQKIITARYTMNMSTLLSSGISMIQALDITSRSVGNAYVSKSVYSIINDVKTGHGLTEPLKNLKIFSPMVIQMTQLGEEAGTLDEMLSQTADFYESEADTATTRMTALMEPVIIVIMGGVVLTIVLSIVLPMFGIYNMIA
ncbi:MAG: type II secretion system F family protein [Saccharofermentanales bacterium]